MHALVKTKADGLSGSLLITDEASRILYANDASVRRSGFALAEAIGKRPGELWGGRMGKAFYRHMWQRIAGEKKSFAAAVSNSDKKGAAYEENLFIVPFCEKEGGVRYFAQVKPQFKDARSERLFREAFQEAGSALSRGEKALPWLLERLEGPRRELSDSARAAGDIVSWIRTHLVLPTETLFAKRHEDAELIRAAQADPAAFSALYERYEKKIEKYFLMRVNRDTEIAADLTQEVFIRSFRALPAFRVTNASYHTYLLHVAHNVLVNHYRRASHDALPLSSEEAERVAFRGASPEGGVSDALSALSEGERHIMGLKYAEGYKAREIAERLGKSENAVKLILSRARKKLRERYR